MKSSKEIADKEGVSRFIVARWAKTHYISMVGTTYVFTDEQADAFAKRNKKRGRPPCVGEQT